MKQEEREAWNMIRGVEWPANWSNGIGGRGFWRFGFQINKETNTGAGVMTANIGHFVTVAFLIEKHNDDPRKMLFLSSLNILNNKWAVASHRNRLWTLNSVLGRFIVLVMTHFFLRNINGNEAKYRSGITAKYVSSCFMLHATHYLSVQDPTAKFKF